MLSGETLDGLTGRAILLLPIRMDGLDYPRYQDGQGT